MAKLNILERLHAGDTLKFTDIIADFLPENGWHIRYVLASKTVKYTFDSVPEGNSHQLNVAATDTATWVPDKYTWAAYAFGNDERHILGTGRIEVIQDLNAGVSSQRSHAESVLDALEAMIEKKATIDQQSMSINGRSISRYEFSDLIIMRDKYKSELLQLKRSERVANGLPAGNKILVRF